MEAVQLSRVQIETDLSHIDHIKECLAGLPATPSYLATTVCPDNSAVDKSARSTITTTTDTNTDSGDSTVATSVLKIPTIFRIQMYHHCPIDVQAEHAVHDLWTSQIRDRFDGIILQEISTGTCTQELMMVGTKPTRLIPNIIVSCGDSKTKKKVEKVFKTLGWLKNLLKKSNMGFLTYNTQICLSSSSQKDSHTIHMDADMCSIQVNESTVTLCGQPIFIGSHGSQAQTRCTFGGVILLDDTPHGLSVAHPFRGHLQNSALTADSLFYNDSLSPDDNADDDDDDDESDLESGNVPFFFNGEDDYADTDEVDETISIGQAHCSTSPINNLGHRCNVNGFPGCETPTDSAHDFNTDENQTFKLGQGISISSIQTTSSGSVQQVPTCTDWAILRLSDQSLLRPNKISHRDSHHDVLISDFYQGTAKGDVIVLAGGASVQIGQLHPSRASLKVEQVCYNVQLITLERVLPLGSSGSWVVTGNALCGFIIATRQDVPWAYMMPIGPVIDDIKQSLSIDNIRLPGRPESTSATDTSIQRAPLHPPGTFEKPNSDRSGPSKERAMQVGTKKLKANTGSTDVTSVVVDQASHYEPDLHELPTVSNDHSTGSQWTPQAPTARPLAVPVSDHNLLQSDTQPVSAKSLVESSQYHKKNSYTSPGTKDLRDRSDARRREWRIPFEKYLLRRAYRLRSDMNFGGRRNLRPRFSFFKYKIARPELRARLGNNPKDIFLGFINVCTLGWHYLLVAIYRSYQLLIGLSKAFVIILWSLRHLIVQALFYLGCGVCHVWVVNKHRHVLEPPSMRERRLQESIHMLGDVYDSRRFAAEDTTMNDWYFPHPAKDHQVPHPAKDREVPHPAKDHQVPHKAKPVQVSELP